jgi:hypothetical protein
MRLPAWLRGEIDAAGIRVADGHEGHDDAITGITDQVFSRDPGLARSIVRDFIGKWLRGWAKGQLRAYYKAEAGQAGGTPGEQLELFTSLPRVLETSPGRFAHVNSMTGPDWDAALRQAEVKASNAEKHAKSIRLAHEQVRPLLDDDGALTTADVTRKIAGGPA